jgi:predicted PurR-regulated permease PerM
MTYNPPTPHWSARQVVLATLSAVAVGIGFWLLYRYRLVVLILFSAIILGTAIRPMVDWLTRRGIARVHGLALTYILLLVALAALLFSLVPILSNQALELVNTIPQTYLDLRTALLQSSSLLLQNLALNLPADMRLLPVAAPVEGEALDIVSDLYRFTGIFLNGFLAIAAIFLLTSYWILESDRTMREVLLYIPPRLRHSARELIEAIEARVGAFVRGQLILSLSIGILALISYMIIGLPNALILALIAAVLEAVPLFGPALGAIPALLVAFSIDPSLALWVVLATVLIQALENYLLVPRVMGASVGVNPVVTLLALATFASLLGLPGALLAIPLAAVIQLLLDRYVFSADQNGTPAPDGRDYNSALRYEVQDLIGDVRKQLRKKQGRSDDETDQIEDSIEALAVELDVLLERYIKEEERA